MLRISIVTIFSIWAGIAVLQTLKISAHFKSKYDESSSPAFEKDEEDKRVLRRHFITLTITFLVCAVLIFLAFFINHLSNG